MDGKRVLGDDLYLGMISMFVLPMTVIFLCYTHIICFVRTAVRRAKRANALPVRKFNLIRHQGKFSLFIFIDSKLLFPQLGALHIRHRFANTKDIRVFRHIIILITVLCIGKKKKNENYLIGCSFSQVVFLIQC